MKNANTIQVTGLLKNIREFNQYGRMVTAQLTQRNAYGSAVFTMPIVTFSDELASALKALDEQVNDETGYTPEVIITGHLSTKFDKRRDVANEDRKAPLTRIEIESVELV